MRRVHRVSHHLRAGTVLVSAYRMVAPNVPFCGWGRESGCDAVREYTERKALWLDLVGNDRDPLRAGLTQRD